MIWKLIWTYFISYHLEINYEGPLRRIYTMITLLEFIIICLVMRFQPVINYVQRLR